MAIQLVRCPHCSGQVVPSGEGLCPSCNQPVGDAVPVEADSNASVPAQPQPARRELSSVLPTEANHSRPRGQQAGKPKRILLWTVFAILCCLVGTLVAGMGLLALYAAFFAAPRDSVNAAFALGMSCFLSAAIWYLAAVLFWRRRWFFALLAAVLAFLLFFAGTDLAHDLQLQRTRRQASLRAPQNLITVRQYPIDRRYRVPIL